MRLKLRPEFEVIPLAGDSVVLRAPDQGVRVRVEGMTGEALAALLAALNGTRPLAAVRDGRVPAVDALLAGLLERDIVEVDPRGEPRADGERLFAQFHDDPAACTRRLASSRALVWGRGGLADLVERELGAAGIGAVTRSQPHLADDEARSGNGSAAPARALADADWPTLARMCRIADLLVCCGGGGATDAAALANRAATRAGIAWMPVRIFAGQAFVGPLFVPGEGPCHACFVGREEANWIEPELTRAYLRRVESRGAGHDPYGGLPGFAAIASQWAVLEATKYLARFTAPALFGHLLRVDFVRCRVQLHRVLRLPRCRECSPLAHLPRIDALLYAGGR